MSQPGRQTHSKAASGAAPSSSAGSSAPHSAGARHGGHAAADRTSGSRRGHKESHSDTAHTPSSTHTAATVGTRSQGRHGDGHTRQDPMAGLPPNATSTNATATTRTTSDMGSSPGARNSPRGDNRAAHALPRQSSSSAAFGASDEAAVGSSGVTGAYSSSYYASYQATRAHGGGGGHVPAQQQPVSSPSSSPAAQLGRIRPTSSLAARAAAAAAAVPPTTTATAASRDDGGGGGGASGNVSGRVAQPTHGFYPTYVPGAPQPPPSPPPPPWTREPLERPPYALSLGIMSVYKSINVRFCTETRRRLSGGHNDGYDDRDGYYLPIIGEEIADRYTVQSILGKGSFGTVLRCCDEKYQLPVAVKIVRRSDYFEAQGRLEAEVVAYLNRFPSLENLIVQLRKVLIWKAHVVLVFELLSFDLYELICRTKFNGVGLELISKFALQLLKVFSQLEQHDPPIIHCDLKPENVVLRDPRRSGIRVIDFGSACYQRQPLEAMPFAQERRRLLALREAHHGLIPLAALCTAVPQASVYSVMPKYVQSRFYRSPEVILELGYTSAIDRWSLGCMLVELHTGAPLFPGRNEADMLALFTAVLGPLPPYMITASPKRSMFYNLTPVNAAVSPVGSPRSVGHGASSAAGVLDAFGTPVVAVATTAEEERVRSVNTTIVMGSGAGSPPVSSVDGAGASLATSLVGGHVPTPPAAPPVTFAGWAVPYAGRRGTTTTSTMTERGSQRQPSPAAAPVVTTTTSGASGSRPTQTGSGSPSAPQPQPLPTEGLYYPTDAQLQLCSGPQNHDKAHLASLEETLGVYSGGPRGCRTRQKGHDPASYECFLDFVRKLLVFDPRERMTCAQALEHPFLQPLLMMEAEAQQQQQQQQQQ